MKTLTIRNIRFEIDEDGFASSSLGQLGHVEECEELAKLLQALFDITSEIEIERP